MNDSIRADALHDLLSVLSAEDVLGAERCAEHLSASLPHPIDLHRNLVLVAFGGGKDSSYALAFVRTVQLLLLRLAGATFRLRVATNRHAGMPRAVMENIDRTYTALRLTDDPDCELLLIDGRQVQTFTVDAPLPAEVIRRNRADILMTGHRTGGDGRTTFCNACNLSMVNSFGIAAGYGEGADLIITGDSPQEQRDYHRWVTRLTRRFDLQPPPAERRGVKGFLASADNIAQAYFIDIHGEQAVTEIQQRGVSFDVPETLSFYSIFEYTDYSSDHHWALLTDLIGFSFDDLAFSFTESDCGNPALMAHLRALKCERVYGRTYAEGITEYFDFAINLMRKKEFPKHLIDVMRQRYDGGMQRMRTTMDTYALNAYQLTEEHLVAMVCTPFVEQGAGLADYLASEQPDLADAVADVHTLLRGDDAYPGVAEALERLSGLTIPQLRLLYTSHRRLTSAASAGNTLLDALLDGDPNKAVIQTRHSPTGPIVSEILSGR